MKDSKIKVVGIGAINLDLIARYSAEDTRNPQISFDASKIEEGKDTRWELITRFLESAPYRQPHSILSQQ